MRSLERLTLVHLWVAFGAFTVACFFGVWQMWARSPLPAPFVTPDHYFLSVTAHGVSMAYVLTTFFIMGFGYFTAETSLECPLPGKLWAWLGFILGIAGTLMATSAILSGRASVMYTFYPPLTGSPFFYCGIVLVIVASWIWCGLMIVAMRQWKCANPDAPVPLAMFATVANAVMWLWTTIGVAAELLFIVIPASLGWTQTVDVGLTRTLFSWTLHPIGYFWLFPAYIAFYTMAPQAAGGRLYSDIMGRLSFALLLLYGLPVGMHHLFMDPEQSTGFKFVQMMLTVLVTVPTLLTVFTISASMEIAGRLRGGRGLFGWIPALPWERPMVLATGLSFVMLFFGGGSGLVNMSYGLNALIHNTSWVTAHFHLIFGGAVVIMYFAIAYEIWPRLTGREALSTRAQRIQLWLWFVGMMVMSLPWHWLGLQGQWRRVAQFDYSNPIIAAWGPWVVVSLFGGLLLLASALLFIWNLASFHRAPALAVVPFRFAVAVYPPTRVPAALNGFGLWNVLVLFLMSQPMGGQSLSFSRKSRRRRSSTASTGEGDIPSPLHAADRPWRVWSAAIVVLFVAAAALLGFIVLPIVQGRSAGVDAFAAICRSLGLQAGSPAARQPSSETRAQPVSIVAWTPQVIDRLRHPNSQNGADLAANICAGCHGENGVSPNPLFPHMAGQSAFAIYKQLHDFKNGARVNELMASVVQGLDDEQMADVAAHFSALTKGALDSGTVSSGDPDIVGLVEGGVSARGLPACASCHGAHAGGPIETPTLAGQRQDYLLAQLNAFAKGDRHNDIYNRMRGIAGKLREDEIEKLAEYYAAVRLFRLQD